MKNKNFFKELFKPIKNINKKILHIINNGFIFSSFLILVGIVLLLLHKQFFISFELIEASMIIFKTSLFFAMQFLICGIAFNKILIFLLCNF